jgi:hypothetical protein
MCTEQPRLFLEARQVDAAGDVVFDPVRRLTDIRRGRGGRVSPPPRVFSAKSWIQDASGRGYTLKSLLSG